MRKHEKHCTLNPQRECRMCKLADNKQPNLSWVMEILPKTEQYKKTNPIAGFDMVEYPGFDEAFKSILPQLKRRAGDCPACILSAIRQAKIPVDMAEGFDYKTEVEAFWKDYNRGHAE